VILDNRDFQDILDYPADLAIREDLDTQASRVYLDTLEQIPEHQDILAKVDIPEGRAILEQVVNQDILANQVILV